MKVLLILCSSLTLLIGCRGTNGENSMSQDELKKDIQKVLNPKKIEKTTITKQDSVVLDSTAGV